MKVIPGYLINFIITLYTCNQTCTFVFTNLELGFDEQSPENVEVDVIFTN